MPRRNAITLFLCLAGLSGFAQDMTVSNSQVAAIVEFLTGRVTIRLAPGGNAPTLSYPEKSFLSILWDDKIYTNNDVGVNLPSDPRRERLTSGVNQRYGDTVRTTWTIQKKQFIQTVYPVNLGSHGQIVMRWSVKNLNTVPAISGLQYLLDLNIQKQDSNNAPEVLTRYGYNRIWEKFSKEPIDGELRFPWFYATFDRKPDVPLPPSFITAAGYTRDVNYSLGLKMPKAITIGDWAMPFSVSLVDNLWGTSPTAPWISDYKDAAILFEWDSVVVAPEETVEIAAMSYGTGAIHMCEGEYVTGLHYPEHIVNTGGKLSPGTFEVNGFVFDRLLETKSNVTSMSLTVGPHLRIVLPDTANVAQKNQRQLMEPVLGYIPERGATTARWVVAADMPNCQGTFDSWLKVKTDDLDTCTYAIRIDCNLPKDVRFVLQQPESLELIGNPATDRTLVRLTLEQAATVAVEVFDVTGRSVSRYVPGNLGAGINEFFLPTQTFPAGVYYVTATYDGKRSVRKLVVQ